MGDAARVLRQFNRTNLGLVKPQWFHPYLEHQSRQPLLKKSELLAFAYDYYLRFLPFFKKTLEGDLLPGIEIAMSLRLKDKLGVADLFTRNIKLNERYFAQGPSLLPYTLFHEMVHLWLYDCFLDPGHTVRFYAKMQDFLQTGLPIDPDVHVHERIASEAKYVYICPNCDHRWYVNEKGNSRLSCGHCLKHEEGTFYPRKYHNRRFDYAPRGKRATEFFAKCLVG